MKKTTILTGITALFCSVIMYANDSTFNNPKTAISEQLQNILSKNTIDVDQKDIKARVLFRINFEGKIEVLQIASERKDVEWFITQKLDGKKIRVEDISADEEFVVDVRVTS